MQNILKMVRQNLHVVVKNIVGKPEVCFLLLAVVFGIIFVRLTPPLWGIDEIEHFSRAYQVSDFKFGVYKVGQSYGGFVPADLVRLGQFAKGDLVDNQTGQRITQRHDLNHIDDYRYLLDRHIRSSPKIETTFQNTAAYSPVSYLPAAFAIGLSRIFNLSLGAAILLARLASLFTWVALVWLAFRLLTMQQKWFLFVVALLPMSLFQATIVNNDSVLNGLCFVLFATLVWTFTQAKKNSRRLSSKQVTLMAILATAVSLTKPSYAILAFSLLLVPHSLFTTKRYEFRVKILWAACIVMSCLVWAVISAPVSGTIGQLRGNDVAAQINPQRQIENSLNNPITPVAAVARTVTLGSDGIVGSYVGVLGWNYVGMPLLAVVYAYVLLVIASIYALADKVKEGFRRTYWGIVGLGSLSALSVFAILYLSFSTVGEPYVAGIQGRYFIPIVPFLALGCVRLSSMKIDFDSKAAARFFGVSIFALLLTATVSYALATY